MPIVLLLLLRPLLMWIVQIALTTLIAELIAGLLKAIVGAVAEHYDIPEDDSRIVVANQVIDVAALIGVGTGVLYSKIGVKAADYLGLKAAGTAKRKLSASSQLKVSAKDLVSKSKSTAFGLIFKQVKAISSLNWLMAFMVLQGAGDWFFFARPQLQSTLRDITGNNDLTLPGGKDAPPGFSDSEWNGYVAALESAGIYALHNVAAKQSQVYSREGLQQIAVWVFGTLAAEGKSTTANALQKAIAPYIRTRSAVAPSTTTSTASSSTGGSSGTTAAPAVQQIKIFTGVVGGGTLGLPQEFVARPDDMIQNADELKAAAKNNLASFVQSLPGRFWYDIGVQNTIRTRGGFSIKGEAVKVISGYTSTGKARYKTVYHKFAVMKLGVEDENGRTVKLATINLGPVNAVDFQPTAAELSAIQGSITPELFTSDVAEIKSIITPEPVTVSASPVESTPPVTLTQEPVTAQQVFNRLNPQPVEISVPVAGIFSDGYEQLFLQRDDGFVWQLRLEQLVPQGTYENYGKQLEAGKRVLRDVYGIDFDAVPAVLIGDWFAEWQRIQPTRWPGIRLPDVPSSVFGRGVLVRATPDKFVNQRTAVLLPSVLNGPVGDVAGASTLNAYYSAYGSAVPSVEARGKLYEAAGLGAASTYTASAEQNNKLLGWLKAQR